MKNSVQLIGRLGSDPSLRVTDSQKSVCNISIATTEKWKNEKDEKVEKTQWHHVVFWGKTAAVVNEHFKKGDLIAIDGKLEYRKYTDKEGIERFSTDIIADQFYFINPKKENNG